MKTPLTTPAVSPASLRPTFGWLATAAFLCAASTLVAQSVIFNSPTAPLVPRVIQKDITPDAASSDIIAGPETGSAIQLGQIKLLPQLALRYMQVNGLPTSPGASDDTSIFTFAPSLGVELGSNWILSYAPTWTNYSEETLTDSTSQSVSVAGAAKVNEWTFRFSESFQSSNDIRAETATQTKQHSWATVLSASRKVGQRSTYDGTVSLNELYGDTFPDSKTWSTSHWLKSQITSKLNAGVGVTLGKTDFTSQDDMHYEMYLGSIRWQSTEKIDLSIEGGLENRHFDTAGVGSLRSPTLQISLGYSPFEHTRLTLANTRAVSNNSYSTNEVTRNTGWSVSLNQRLLEKLNLSMTYNDQTNDYKSFAATSVPTVRSDEFKSFNTSLGVRLLKYWTLSAIYQNSKNASDSSGFNFSTTQYGVELSGAF